MNTVSTLHTFLKEQINISDTEWDAFNAILGKKEFKAKTAIIKEGAVAKKLYFIESGLLRTYYLLDGKEISTYFACGDQFMSVFSSFIGQSPSFETLEALEDTRVYQLSYDDLSRLYQEHSVFEKLGRVLAEKTYLCTINRTLTLQTKTAKEKYLDFIENYDKKIIQRVPQHQIASFLGITPESLSRVRREISTSYQMSM